MHNVSNFKLARFGTGVAELFANQVKNAVALQEILSNRVGFYAEDVDYSKCSWDNWKDNDGWKENTKKENPC